MIRFVLFTLIALLPAAADAARTGSLPDFLVVYGARVDENGVIDATGGASLHITSLIEGAEIVISADDVLYDTVTGIAELEGDVNLSVTDTTLSIDCTYLYYDPMMEQMQIEGAMLTVPLKAVVEPGRVPGADSFLLDETHFYNFDPDLLMMAAGTVDFDLAAEHPAVIMTDVMLTHYPSKDSDLFLHSQRVSFTDSEHIEFEDIELRASGMEIFTWPSLTRGLTPQPKLVSLDFPKFRINRDVGLAWRQGIKVDMGTFKSDATLDYSPEYGALLYNRAYYSPDAWFSIGVASGTKTVVDLKRRTIERRDEAVAFISRKYEQPFGTIDVARLDIEYGDVHSTTRSVPVDEIDANDAEDTRFHTNIRMDFTPVELSDHFYLTSGAGITYTDYEQANESYRVVSGKAGVVWRQPHFDHYLIYQSRNIEGEPVFSFDEQRAEELDFGTSFRIHPEWRHVVQGIYDIDLGKFDKLQVGAMKKQKAYEIGLFWDFARENAGIEIGLLTGNFSKDSD